jgi:hypothetical protein
MEIPAFAFFMTTWIIIYHRLMSAIDFRFKQASNEKNSPSSYSTHAVQTFFLFAIYWEHLMPSIIFTHLLHITSVYRRVAGRCDTLTDTLYYWHSALLTPYITDTLYYWHPLLLTPHSQNFCILGAHKLRYFIWSSTPTFGERGQTHLEMYVVDYIDIFRYRASATEETKEDSRMTIPK